MKNNYIQATVELIKHGSKTKEVFEGLYKAMQKKQHLSLYPAVLRGVSRILETEQDKTLPWVMVAKETDSVKHETQIHQSLSLVGADKDFVIKIDPNIIGGFIIKHNNKMIDRSYKSTLSNIYTSSITKEVS